MAGDNRFHLRVKSGKLPGAGLMKMTDRACRARLTLTYGWSGAEPSDKLCRQARSVIFKLPGAGLMKMTDRACRQSLSEGSAPDQPYVSVNLARNRNGRVTQRTRSRNGPQQGSARADN